MPPTATSTSTATVEPIASATPVDSDSTVDDDPFLGPRDAPVVMVEFSDFNCGFCRRFHHETLPLLLNLYPDELLYVYRDFPVVGGGEVGLAAAQAANCAGEQGAYWEYHDALFSGTFGLNRDGYSLSADALGLDSVALLQCLDSGRYADEVMHDWNEGRSLGVTGTPTFFINGTRLIGAQPLEMFTAIIDDELGR